MTVSRRAVLAAAVMLTFATGRETSVALKPQGNNIAAGTSLAIAQLNSPDYVPGVSGWAIFQDGSVEFNSGTFRDTITITQADGTILKINNEFITYYDSTGTNVIGQVAVFDPVNGGLSLSGFNPSTHAVSSLFLLGNAAGNVVVPGVLAANEPNASSGTPASWHPLALTTVTASGNGVNGFRYKLMPGNLLALEWDLATNSVGNNVTVATLPAGWRPAKAHNIASGSYGGSSSLTTGANPHFVVNTDGTIVTGGFAAAAFDVCGTALIGMD